MKRFVLMIITVLILGLLAGCGEKRVKVNISDGGDLSVTAVPGKETERETVSATTEAESETESMPMGNEQVFIWKGYSMNFSYMTVDLGEHDLEELQDSMVLVRLAAVEGTIALNDFKQNLFELVDPDGNVYTCKFFVVANKSSNPVLNGTPEARQDYIDMLFEMSDATMEDLAASHINVYEEAGGQPIEVPLNSVPQEV